jgi:group II intron reverse transcriptase/maturase
MKERRKQSGLRMNLVGERRITGGLFVEETPVWYGSSGKVTSLWLSACKEERKRTSNLMEAIAEPSNLIAAYKEVASNKGAGGIDGMDVWGLKEWLSVNLEKLRESLMKGSYHPQAVLGVNIPKPHGGYRRLGIPTAKDRLVQQAISRVLMRMYEPIFSAHSYGFRPNRNAHQALIKSASYLKEGKEYVVDLDLEKFFDEVNHHRLMWLLGTRIGDERLLNLIRKFLTSGIISGGMTEQRVKGTPQGSPLSPLLSNIVLDELDQELARRGHSFVRYADDVKIFVRSHESAERVERSITGYIEGRMKLKVNREKSRICRGYELNFLGHSILKGGNLGLSKASENRLKEKVREVTRRKRGISLEAMIKELNVQLKGWLNYFYLARMQSKLSKLDAWIRRKLKCFRLKQCKRVIGIVRFLRSLKVEEKLSWKTALSGKGWWPLSNSPAIAIGMNNNWFTQLGLFT